MTLRESALVAFTLLMQTSVGIVLIVVALQALVPRSSESAGRLFALPLGIACAAGVLALVASLFHLGQPLDAWLAVGNVRSSWLSREILLALLFVLFGTAFAAIDARDAASSFARVLSVLACILGIAAIAAMSRLYMVPAQPAWNNVMTPAGFFATTLLAGIVVVLVSGEMQAQPIARTTIVRTLALAAIFLVAIQLVLVPVYLSVLPREPSAAISRISAGGAAAWLAAARVLPALGALTILLNLLRASSAALPTARTGMVLVALVTVTEVVGRVLFYAASASLSGGR